MNKPNQPLLTVNQIGDQLGVAFWQVRHVVNTRSGIVPAVTHRSVKLYDAEGITKIKAALKSIDKAKQAKQRTTATS